MEVTFKSYKRYDHDGFYLNDPFETEMLNKKSIFRHFGPKYTTQLEMGNTLKFTEINSFLSFYLFVHSPSVIRLLESKTKLFTMPKYS